MIKYSIRLMSDSLINNEKHKTCEHGRQKIIVRNVVPGATKNAKVRKRDL
jgi:hypothetical protein